MIFWIIFWFIIFRIVYANVLDYQIKRDCLRNKVNTYSAITINNSNIKYWYNKSFSKDFHKYIYDLSPFKYKLWIISLIDRKSFKRYLSIDQFNVVVVLTSLHLIMLDNKFTTKELKYIDEFYSQFLDQKKKSDLIWLLGIYKKNGINLIPKLKGNLVLESVIEGINHYLSKQHKFSLIYYLFELAESDKDITNKELNFIYRLGKSISLSKQELNSITSLYFSTYIPYPGAGFSKKKKEKSKEKRKTRRSKYSSHSKLENALSIFNLNKDASNKEIKIAYRKMVKRHHPDRVNHLGDEHVLKATELFKRINVAYDYLEEVRGI